MFLEQKRQKKYFFVYSSKDFLEFSHSQREKTEKTILFFPNKFCYHESSINQTGTRPNSGFRACVHISRNICLGISKCSQKVRENMT